MQLQIWFVRQAQSEMSCVYLSIIWVYATGLKVAWKTNFRSHFVVDSAPQAPGQNANLGQRYSRITSRCARQEERYSIGRSNIDFRFAKCILFDSCLTIDSLPNLEHLFSLDNSLTSIFKNIYLYRIFTYLSPEGCERGSLDGPIAK